MTADPYIDEQRKAVELFLSCQRAPFYHGDPVYHVRDGILRLCTVYESDENTVTVLFRNYVIPVMLARSEVARTKYEADWILRQQLSAAQNSLSQVHTGFYEQLKR